MLVNMRNLLSDAQKGNYAVGSFSVANMEMVLGVLKAAEELCAPVILQIAEVRLKQSPLELIGPLMVAAAKHAKTLRLSSVASDVYKRQRLLCPFAAAPNAK